MQTAVAGIVHEEEIDLIVLSTKGAEGLPAWFNPSISESIARKSTVPTLFIPNDTKPFVDIESGELNLEKILIPVDHEPKPQRGVEFALNMGKIYGKGKSEIHIMHVLNKNNGASEEDLPELKVPDDEECVVRIELNNSSVTEEISKVSDEINADLIVIPTEGRRGFADALFGSTSERVIRHSKCPTLSIPVAIGKFLTRS